MNGTDAFSGPAGQGRRCGDADGGNEGVGASVIAGVDAAPVLEFAENVLDPVTLAIEGRVVRDGHFAVRL